MALGGADGPVGGTGHTDACIWDGLFGCSVEYTPLQTNVLSCDRRDGTRGKRERQVKIGAKKGCVHHVWQACVVNERHKIA
jgi:hypothetical protein